MPKIKVPSIFRTLNPVCSASQRESFHIFFKTTMSEAKETIIIGDESEDDGTEELLSIEETCLIAR